MSEAERNLPVSLTERRIHSPVFHTLYDEGMGLVEEAAAYLDGDGRHDVRVLEAEVAALYAAESMRLTTRLMQLASWLLLQRAANSGEMSREQIAAEKAKVRLDTESAFEQAPSFGDLPDVFKSLVARSLSLQTRVRRMEEEIHGLPLRTGHDRISDNPVSEQIMLLRTAFAH